MLNCSVSEVDLCDSTWGLVTAVCIELEVDIGVTGCQEMQLEVELPVSLSSRHAS